MQEVLNGNHEVKLIKESNIIDFVLTLEIFRCKTFQDVFDCLKLILKDVVDYGMFTYIFTCLAKLSKNSNNTEEFTKEIFELLYEDKSSFKIKKSLENCEGK